jgi:hypothetical protein
MFIETFIILKTYKKDTIINHQSKIINQKWYDQSKPTAKAHPEVITATDTNDQVAGNTYHAVG